MNFDHIHSSITPSYHLPHFCFAFFLLLPLQFSFCFHDLVFTFLCFWIFLPLLTSINERKICDTFLYGTGLFHLMRWPIFQQITQYVWVKLHFVHIYYIFLNHSSVDVHLGWFHNSAILDSAMINMSIHVSLQQIDFDSHGYIPGVVWLDHKEVLYIYIYIYMN
jgi:hypothetical protein